MVQDNDSTTPTELTTGRYSSSSGYTGTRVFNSQIFVGRMGAQMKAGPSGFRPFHGEGREK